MNDDGQARRSARRRSTKAGRADAVMPARGASTDGDYSATHPLPLEDSIPFRLAVAANLNGGLWQRRRTQRLGLTLTDWRVLMLVVTRPGVSARDVAARIGVDKMSITRSVQRLLAGRYIRTATNARDRRRLALTVAPRGAAIYDQMMPLLAAHQKRLFRDFSTTEQVMLAELLAKLTRALREMGAESGWLRRLDSQRGASDTGNIRD